MTLTALPSDVRLRAFQLDEETSSAPPSPPPDASGGATRRPSTRAGHGPQRHRHARQALPPYRMAVDVTGTATGRWPTTMPRTSGRLSSRAASRRPAAAPRSVALHARQHIAGHLRDLHRRVGRRHRGQVPVRRWRAEAAHADVPAGPRPDHGRCQLSLRVGHLSAGANRRPAGGTRPRRGPTPRTPRTTSMTRRARSTRRSSPIASTT